MDNATVAVRPAPELNLDVIKKYVCPKATDQEAFTFLQLCKAQNLNPFLREAYLVKYGDEAATIITGKDTFTKRADRLIQYDGFKAGIIVLSNNQVLYREGSFLVNGETLLGGWAEVFRKDRTQPFRNEVSLTEYERKKKDGTVMSNWKSMPATMIRKVALVQSLREAFPDEFGGMYSPEEMPVDSSALPTYNYGERPQIPVPQENGKPPITQPGRKSETKTEGKPEEQTITIQIGEITSKDGTKKDGKPYTLHTIFDANGNKYGTFDTKLADLAQLSQEQGFPVQITYTEGKFGKNITNLVEVERQPGDDVE